MVWLESVWRPYQSLKGKSDSQLVLHLRLSPTELPRKTPQELQTLHFDSFLPSRGTSGIEIFFLLLSSNHLPLYLCVFVQTIFQNSSFFFSRWKVPKLPQFAKALPPPLLQRFQWGQIDTNDLAVVCVPDSQGYPPTWLFSSDIYQFYLQIFKIFLESKHLVSDWLCLSPFLSANLSQTKRLQAIKRMWLLRPKR